MIRAERLFLRLNPLKLFWYNYLPKR